MVNRCINTTTTSSSENCRKYLNQKCRNCSILKRICQKIIRDYYRTQCREKYSVFDGGNSINIRIRRSSTQAKQGNCIDHSTMRADPCPAIFQENRRKNCNGYTKGPQQAAAMGKTNSFLNETRKGSYFQNTNLCGHSKQQMCQKQKSCNHVDILEKSTKTQRKPLRKDKSNQTPIVPHERTETPEDETRGSRRKNDKTKKQKGTKENDMNKSDPGENTKGGTVVKRNSNQDHNDERKKKRKSKKISTDTTISQNLEIVQKGSTKMTAINKDKEIPPINRKDRTLRDLSNNHDEIKKNTNEIAKSNRKLKPGRPNDQNVKISTKKRTESDFTKTQKSKNKLNLKDQNRRNQKTNKIAPLKNTNDILIKDLRWKVRNGLDIRGKKSPRSSKYTQPKEKINTCQSRDKKYSRFDQKPWDILRASMEEREQCALLSKPPQQPTAFPYSCHTCNLLPE